MSTDFQEEIMLIHGRNEKSLNGFSIKAEFMGSIGRTPL